MQMKTHFSTISFYLNLQINNFFKMARLVHMFCVLWIIFIEILLGLIFWIVIVVFLGDILLIIIVYAQSSNYFQIDVMPPKVTRSKARAYIAICFKKQIWLSPYQSYNWLKMKKSFWTSSSGKIDTIQFRWCMYVREKTSSKHS